VSFELNPLILCCFCSGFDCLKLHIKYGGDVSICDESFAYIRGFEKRDMLIDPDLMTWSIFADFPAENGVSAPVEKVWYKLAHESFESVRAIGEDRDSGIRQLCSEALIGGEVDVYIEQGMSEPTPFPMSQHGEEAVVEEMEESDAEVEGDKTGEEDRGKDDDVDPVAECEGDDPRFRAFYEEINEEDNNHQDAGEAAGQGIPEADEGHVTGQEAGVDEGHVTGQEAGQEAGQEGIDEEEFEDQCMDTERPDAALDTDEEWDALDREEREIARAKFTKDKPPYLWLKQQFNNGEEFKDQLLRYVLKTNYDVKLCKWGQKQLMAICSHENCQWKIYCSVDKRVGKWTVKTYVDAHKHAISGKARMLKQGVIARLFRDEARRRPTLTWVDIKDEIMMRYTISVSKWICRKARRMAFDMVIETQRQQFAKLWDYEGELQRSNKHTHIEIVTIPRADGKQQFDKFYICFEKLRTTWKSCCRPIIGLDGAFLKWELKGEILAAVGRDADNRIYPIAWAIVRVEDNEAWAWFVEKLKEDLDLGVGASFTVISDKQKGLINAVADLLPQAEHRHCARHIYANWKKVYGDYCHESYFWAIAYSATEGDYSYNMDAMRSYDPDACDDLLKTDPTTWCRAFFSTHSSCEDVSNNLSESFNRTIREARKLPVVNMLEEVRRISMKRIAKLCDKTAKCETRFPPKIMQILEGNRKSSKYCQVLKSGENKFEILEGSGYYSVDLLTRTCGCRQWELTGIPCPHAIYVITEHNRDPEE